MNKYLMTDDDDVFMFVIECSNTDLDDSSDLNSVSL